MHIELSPDQVQGVIHSAAGSYSTATLMLGLETIRNVFTDSLGNQRLSKSLVQGLWILSCFPPDGSHIRLGAVAQATGISPSNVHRYVTTLVAAGLVERHAQTHEYRLSWVDTDATAAGLQAHLQHEAQPEHTTQPDGLQGRHLQQGCG